MSLFEEPDVGLSQHLLPLFARPTPRFAPALFGGFGRPVPPGYIDSGLDHGPKLIRMDDYQDKLKSMCTGVKTWICAWDPETTDKSSEYRALGEAGPNRARQSH